MGGVKDRDERSVLEEFRILLLLPVLEISEVVDKLLFLQVPSLGQDWVERRH